MRQTGFKLISSMAAILLLLNLATASSQKETGKSGADQPKQAVLDKNQTKKCLNTAMQCCTDRSKNSLVTIDSVMSSLSTAGDSGDPAQMKAAIETAKKELLSLKDEHNKSYHLLNAATKHLEKLRKQGNSKTKRLIDEADPSWDDVIWAF